MCAAASSLSISPREREKTRRDSSPSKDLDSAMFMQFISTLNKDFIVFGISEAFNVLDGWFVVRNTINHTNTNTHTERGRERGSQSQRPMWFRSFDKPKEGFIGLYVISFKTSIKPTRGSVSISESDDLFGYV